jgi:hypothetical protein
VHRSHGQLVTPDSPRTGPIPWLRLVPPQSTDRPPLPASFPHAASRHRRVSAAPSTSASRCFAHLFGWVICSKISSIRIFRSGVGSTSTEACNSSAPPLFLQDQAHPRCPCLAAGQPRALLPPLEFDVDDEAAQSDQLSPPVWIYSSSSTRSTQLSAELAATG